MISTSDDYMIWYDMRNMLAIMSEHKPAYCDKVNEEINMKLATIDVLKPSFEYTRDGFKYQTLAKGIPRITHRESFEYEASGY